MMFEPFSLFFLQRSSVSKASVVAQEGAKVQKILSEKKFEQLKRAKGGD